MPSVIELNPAHFHYSFAAHPPELRVTSGTRVRVVCPDSDNEMSDGKPVPQERRCPGPGGWTGNPVAGPIFVECAEPGDSISVRIDVVHLERATGQTLLAPNHGFLSSELLVPPEIRSEIPRRMYRWDIDNDRGLARLRNAFGTLPIVIPLKPFVGCIGVCPGQGLEVSTLYSGAFGGNLDLPLTEAGATILFPVFEPGGLLAMGDIHAAQGQGEIIGGAIETSGRIDCEVGLRKDYRIAAPRIVTSTHLAAIGLDADLKQAVARAYAHLLGWIVTDYGINRWDAYNLISQTGSIVLGNLLVSPSSVAACLPRNLLPQTNELS